MKLYIFQAAIAAILCTPVVSQDVCLVCGEGKQVGKPDEVFAFPNQPAVPCGALEQSGLEGKIPNTQCGFLPGFITTACGCESAPAPVSAPTVDAANNDDGDCVCYGSVTTDRNLLTHRAIQENAVRRTLREVDSIRKKREEAMRVLQGVDEDCSCVEVCDDDIPGDDDEPSTGKKGKGTTGKKGKGTTGKKGKGTTGKKGKGDVPRDDDEPSEGKKGKGSSGKGSSGKKGKGTPGKKGKGDEPRDDDEPSTGKKGKGSSGKGSSGKKGKGTSGKGTTGKGNSGKGDLGKGDTGKGDVDRFEDDCICECYQGECDCTCPTKDCPTPYRRLMTDDYGGDDAKGDDAKADDTPVGDDAPTGDDAPVDDTPSGKGTSGKGTSTGKKGKGTSGKGTSPGKKGKGTSGKGTSGKGKTPDGTRDDDETPTGKKGKGSKTGKKGKGKQGGKKGKKGSNCKTVCTCKPTPSPAPTPSVPVASTPPSTDIPGTEPPQSSPPESSPPEAVPVSTTPPATAEPSLVPFSTETAPPTQGSSDCLETCICKSGSKITVKFSNPEPLADDWVGLYKCLDTPDGIYNYHPDAWLWTCYDSVCTGNPPSSGTLVFEDPLPAYNAYGLGQWPLDPDQCYVALLNRNVGRSPPPYDMICEGDEFIL